MGRMADALDKADFYNDVHKKSTPPLHEEGVGKSDRGSVPVKPDSGSIPVQPDRGSAPVKPDSGSIPVQPDRGGAPMQPNRSSAPVKPASDDIVSTEMVNGAWDERFSFAVNSDPHLPEVFKVLRSRILHPTDGRAVSRSILVTSIAPMEGKTFVTANIGVSIAHGLDQHALLVDCDLRCPSLAGMFGMPNKSGLVDHLRDGKELSLLIRKSPVDKLSVLPSGIPPVNPAELLGSYRMPELIRELHHRYDDRTIFFDSPPVQVAAETIVLAGHVDGVIIVVRAGGSGKTEILKTIDIIGKEKIIGVVFNGHTTNFFEKSLSSNTGYY